MPARRTGPDRPTSLAQLQCSVAQGALEMGEMEHLLNVYASRSAPNSIADFVGYAQVGEHEANRRLTEGLWLVRDPCNHDECFLFKLPGSSTLQRVAGILDCAPGHIS